MRRFDNVAMMRARERANIARMIRDSEAGWLFYPPGRPPVGISATDAERIEAALVANLERYLQAGKRMQMRIVAVGVVAAMWLMTVTALAPDYGPLALTILTPAIFAYVAWEGSLDLRYRLERRRWCRSEADRIGSSIPIPAGVAVRSRRHNLFAAASSLVAGIGVLRIVWLALTRDDLAAAADPIAMGLIGLAWLLMLPAWKVDSTHRRRRWLT